METKWKTGQSPGWAPGSSASPEAELMETSAGRMGNGSQLISSSASPEAELMETFGHPCKGGGGGNTLVLHPKRN